MSMRCRNMVLHLEIRDQNCWENMFGSFLDKIKWDRETLPLVQEFEPNLCPGKLPLGHFVRLDHLKKLGLKASPGI